MSSSEREITTVRVSKRLHSRLKDLKPYDSVSFDELLTEMADEYEKQQNN